MNWDALQEKVFVQLCTVKFNKLKSSCRTIIIKIESDNFLCLTK